MTKIYHLLFLAVLVTTLCRLSPVVTAKLQKRALYSEKLLWQDEPNDDIYAPYKCATCTTLVGLIDQWRTIHSKPSSTKTLYDFCAMLPFLFRYPCDYGVRSFGTQLASLLEKNDTADYICSAMGICDVATNGMPKCNVYPFPQDESKFSYAGRLRKHREQFALHASQLMATQFQSNSSSANLFKNFLFQNRLGDLTFDPCKVPGIGTLCKYIETIFTLRRPLFDKDRDSFGFQPALRGYTWRGRDCSDLNWDTYPGRQPSKNDRFFDSNCNGIKGINFHSGLTYETELCSTSGARGIAVLGDSVSAHFHVPVEFLNASMLSTKMLANLTFVVENEADWPQLSYITGYEQSSWPVVQGKTDSVYLRLRERNLCNHRDYQNLAENGADTFSAIVLQQSLARDKKKDKPLILFYAFVGNDVCNHYVDTLDHATHAEAMRKNLNASFEYLGTRLPNGSYAVVIDIADARFLYESMHDRIHPIGALRQDVTFRSLYDYFNCLDVNPCRGFLNSNESLRNLTYERVQVLNEVIRTTVEENKERYDNYKIYYMPNPLADVFAAWTASGGELWQLVEPADGFHPNQFAHGIIGGVIWDNLLKMDEDIVGPINPNNDRIKKLFKNQGGH